MALPVPLACDGQVTFDPATRSLFVKVSGFGGSFWRRGHAALLKAEEAGRYYAVRTVWAHGARGEPVRDGWLRFKLPDPVYRELVSEPGLSAIVTVDREAAQILGVRFLT